MNGDKQANGSSARTIVSEIRAWFPLILAILVPGLVWGLKLEINDNQQRHESGTLAVRVGKMETSIDRGILPIAQEKIAALEKELKRIEENCKKHANQ